MEETLILTQEWDKIFPKSEKMEHRKVTFHNRCGITLAADLYTPKVVEGKLPATAAKAHSCYFSRDAFAKLTGGNKEQLIIPGAVHTDLYDRVDVIPFDKLDSFFHNNLAV